jgi:hypothetical protein
MCRLVRSQRGKYEGVGDEWSRGMEIHIAEALAKIKSTELKISQVSSTKKTKLISSLARVLVMSP